MYRAKETGKKGYVIFSQEMTDRVQRRVSLENRLRDAYDFTGTPIRLVFREQIRAKA